MAADGDEDLDLQAIVSAVLERDAPLSADNLAAFDALLDGSDYSADQRRDVLQAIWNLVGAFIDFEWRHHPVQQAHSAAHNSCGKPIKTACERPNPTASVLHLKPQETTRSFQKAAHKEAAERAS